MDNPDGIKYRYEALAPHLDERVRRLLAAAEARSFGRGGIRLVSEITGMARSTIGRGVSELGGETAPSEPGRVRRPGGGRKPETEKQPERLSALEALVEPTERGDPESPLRWTSKSCRRLSNTLKEQGFSVSRTLGGSFSRSSATRFRETRRHGRARTLPIAMASSSASTTRSRTSWPAGSR